jgi:hypothetical protein
MCFSAQASFTSSVVISAIGVATLNKVTEPKQRLFAVIPLLFGFQQFTEGVLWTTLRSGEHAWLQNVAAHAFLVAALIIWPIMIPTSMWLMEEAKQRKKILLCLMLAGGILSLFYTCCLIFYHITPQINSFHILYLNDFPNRLGGSAFLFYFATTVVPLFVSSVRRMWLFGVLITISLLVTGVLFQEYLTSVWCFFAALMSVSIYWVLYEFRSKVGILATEINDDR